MTQNLKICHMEYIELLNTLESGLILQGDSVARGPNLFPTKNYVIEIMT